MTAKQAPPGSDTGDDELTELAATRVSKRAKKLIADRAQDTALTASAWHRRVLYRALGILKKEE